MNDYDATHFNLAKLARSLGRISIATRAIGILMVILSLLVMLVSMVQLLGGHHTDDNVAYFFMALCVAGLGVLVWGTGTFHAAMAKALPMLGWIDGKLWEIMRVAREQPRAMAVGPSRGPAIASETATHSSDGQGALTPAEDQATSPGAYASSAEEPTAAQAQPPQARRCRHCGGEIGIDVLRCKHCLERV